MNHHDDLDRPYLHSLGKQWGMDKLESIARYSRTAIYQWRPSRGYVPPEAALRVCEFAETLGFTVEALCPDLPWHLVYPGRDRRSTYVGTAALAMSPDDMVREIGVAVVAKVCGKSRQAVYDALRMDKPPVWLALGTEQASERRFLAEDFRPDLPWWPLYNRRHTVMPLDEKHQRKFLQLVK